MIYKSKPINLAVLIWSGSTFGGAERRFARLAYYLENNFEGVNVTIYCPQITLIPLGMVGIDLRKIKILSIAPSKRNIFFYKIESVVSILKFILCVRRVKYDNLFIASNPGLISYIITRFSAILPRISVGMVDPFFSEYSTWLDRYFVNRTLRRVSSVDCLSYGVKEAFMRCISTSDMEKICVAPCSFTDYSQVEESQVRDIDVVLLGRFAHGKGHELLERISDQLAGLSIHVCGSGPVKPNIPAALIYESQHSFNLLSRAKISLSLQKFDNYPSQVVLESMASSCAIIATDTGETRKLLDGTCAILIPYDHEALIEAIKYLLSNPDRCTLLGKSAKEKVLSEHTIERYSRYFINQVINNQ